MISPESSRSHVSTYSILQEGCAVTIFNSDIAAAITCPESVWSRGAGARLRHRHHRRLVPAARHRGPDLPPHQELRRSARRSSLPTAVAVSNNVSRHDKGKRISGWAENAARRGRHGAGDEHRRGGGAGRRGRLCQWRGGRCVRLPNPHRMRRPSLIGRSVLPRSDLAGPSVCRPRVSNKRLF